MKAEGKRQRAEGIPLAEWVVPRVEKVMPSEYPDEPYLGLDDIEAQTTRLIGSKSAGEMKSSAKRFYPGDVLYSRLRPYLNKVWLADRSGLCSAEFIVLPSNGFIAGSFLKYRLNARDFVSFANSLNAGDRPRVDFDQISAFCLPPFALARQRRIVAKIEKLFSELDAGEASLKTARHQLGVYRQSLLKQAFEGKLTAPWRAQNPDLLESPDQLLTRIQEEREARYEQLLPEWEATMAEWESNGKEGKRPAKPKPPGSVEPISTKRLAELPALPNGWIWQTIENLVDQGRACAYGVLKPGPHVESGIPLVRVGDIQNGSVSTADMKRIAPAIAQQYRRTELRGGEFLISLVGAIGRTAVVQSELRGANTARAVGVVPLSQVIDPDFVEICFRSPAKLAEMVSQANEVARKTLNLEDVRKATVPLCSLPEQHEIVRLLDEQFEVIEQNEREIDAALKRSEALRQSILKKAFTGQLVPQDPNDEPASSLLARIQAERENAEKSAKIKKKAARKRASKRAKNP